jgi:hypothetical protein
MRTWRAFCNMLLTALRNPVWAILSILASPFRAGTFLSNAGVLQVFGVNDHDSARLVSDLLCSARKPSYSRP